jgi:hypothetical protein
MDLKQNIISCPHCNEFIIIEKLNCGIFRHGVVKETGKQIDPHLNKEECNNLFNNNLIYGCGKPFQIIITIENNYEIKICNYI